MPRPVARPAQPSLIDYEEHELRAAHAELYAERRISLPFHVAIASDIWSHFIRCRAYDRRNRDRARARSEYVPALKTDIRATIARAMSTLQPYEQRSLELEDRA